MKKRNEHKKTNEQPNGKVFFQRLMMLMLIFMVSTTFIGCDILNEPVDPDDPGGTNNQINSPIVATWENWDYNTLVQIYYYYDYVFKSDGTFFYVIRNSEDCFVTVYKGDYGVKDNKISIKNRKQSPQFNYAEKGYFKPPWTRYEEISAIIEASKTVTFTNATNLSVNEELTFELSNDTQIMTEYETNRLTITTSKGNTIVFRKVKK